MGKQVEAFFDKILEDDELKRKVAKLSDDMYNAYDTLAQIARDAGYDVTVEELRASKLSFSRSENIADELVKSNLSCTSVCTDICGMHLGHWLGRQR